MPPFLPHALAFADQWIGHHMEAAGLPGCSLAVVHGQEIVHEKAWGVADLATGEKLTPRHRFRIASHSKTYTAAGLMRLRDQGRIGLDDRIGTHIAKLHPSVAERTVAEILSHGGGLVRDGADSGQFMDRRRWRTREEIRADLAKPQPVEPGTRFKYSNHGFALAGLLIEAVTGEDYDSWMRREIIGASALRATTTDLPQPMTAPYAHGHSLRLSDGSRLVVPAADPTNAIAAAGGFVAPPSDVARFFASLAPGARRSALSVAARREMIRPRLADREGALPWHYGLGTISGTTAGLDWFGHSGSFQGTLSRTVVLPGLDVTVSVMTNSLDGYSAIFTDGIIGILSALRNRGTPSRTTRGWTGTWWSLWGPVALVPVRDAVLAAAPGTFAPLYAAPEIAPAGGGKGLIVRGSGFGSPGERALLVRDGKGRGKELWLGGAKLLPRAAFEREMRARYGRRKRRKR